MIKVVLKLAQTLPKLDNYKFEVLICSTFVLLRFLFMINFVDNIVNKQRY